MTEPSRRRPLRTLLRGLRRGKGLVVASDLPPADAERVVKAIDEVLGQRETNAQRAAAQRLVHVYAGLDDQGRRRFLETLASRFGTDPVALDRAVARMRNPGPDRIDAERDLRRAVIPRYAALLHVVTGLSQGVRSLVELRADVLAVKDQNAGLGLLDEELTGHLATLFDVGLLELRQITWDSPASVLDRLMATEAVHEIRGWDDLKHRLDGDQRCYGFFHPALPNEPLVFVEIALTHGLADNLPELLHREGSVEDADTAIFYSITSCQPGLAGVHLGNELIKQVVDELRHDVDHLKTFATLSPLPGFRRWLTAQVDGGELTPAERESFGSDARRIAGPEHRLWLDDAAMVERVRPGVLSAGARYLMSVRDGRAIDPVANFHLSNGASLERINWMANPAPYGLEESLGLMVNYRYDRGRIAANAGDYLADGSINASNHVRGLVKTAKL